jgi:hypothetical protein
LSRSLFEFGAMLLIVGAGAGVGDVAMNVQGHLGMTRIYVQESFLDEDQCCEPLRWCLSLRPFAQSMPCFIVAVSRHNILLLIKKRPHFTRVLRRGQCCPACWARYHRALATYGKTDTVSAPEVLTLELPFLSL